MKKEKRKKFNLKDGEVTVIETKDGLFLVKWYLIYPIYSSNFKEVTARLSLAEKKKKDFLEVLWSLIVDDYEQLAELEGEEGYERYYEENL